MIWKLLPQIVAISSLVIVTVLDYYWYDRRTTKFKKARHALLWVILLFMLLTVVAIYIDEANVHAEKAALHSQISGLQTRLNEIHDMESTTAARASMKPQFKIFLARQNSTNKTELTEGCILIIPLMVGTNDPAQHISIHNPASPPLPLDLPMPNGSNSDPILIGIQNVGSAPAKGLQATFFYEDRIACQTDPAWVSLIPGRTWLRAGTNMHDIKCHAVGYQADRPLFQPSGLMLPPLTFLPGTNVVFADALDLLSDGTNWHASLHSSPAAPKHIAMALELQTEDTPRTSFGFSAIFYLSKKTTDPYIADGPPDKNGNTSILFHQ